MTADERRRPFVLYDTLRIHAEVTERGIEFREQEAKVDFAGIPDPDADDLAVEEQRLVCLALGTHLRGLVLDILDFDRTTPFWYALEIPRPVVVPDDPGGKPGDFDIVVGRTIDGRPSVDDLGVVEVKRFVVRPDGSDARCGSGNGTEQALGALATGFDRVGVLHLLVSADRATPVDVSPSAAALVSADQSAALDRAVGRFREKFRSCGLAIIGWSRAPGTDPTRTGASILGDLRRATFQAMRDDPGFSARRESLATRFRLLFERQPSAPFYRWFTCCVRLVPTSDLASATCDSCGRP